MDNYESPKWILDLFSEWFDPCPLNPTPKINGLNIDWKNKTFVNPPYSNPLPWIEKAILENKKGKTIVLLLKVDTSTKWFQKLVENNVRLFWINKRLKFNGKSPAPFPSMLAVLSQWKN